VLRVATFDGGMNLGMAALGGGQDPISRCRHAQVHADVARAFIIEQDAAVVGFATPFVGQTRGKPKQFIKGKPVWGSGNAPIPPDNIRPLFGCLTVIEMVVEDLNEERRQAGDNRPPIRCVEVDEPEARRAFLTAVPRKSKDIKIAIQRACTLRRWPWSTEHGADALCIASWVLEWSERDNSHSTTPLFQPPESPA
jgi:hypothetical protein